ncbi:hypothetical protein ALO62_103529 [Pseudomonas amygdali pv. myricae]|nr:hypothetical protein ALO62_103529 [Pseudomonas amygdali pv. myricae]RMV22250.1 hypothetical protein ALP14_102719 [Pseudomonas amygdali pv. myricae]
MPAILGQISRRKVERDPPRRKIQSGIENGTAHPVLALLDRPLRQPHQRQGRQAVGQMRFNSNRRGFHPDLGTTMDDSQRHGSFLDMSDGRVSCFICGMGVRGEWIQGVSGTRKTDICFGCVEMP